MKIHNAYLLDRYVRADGRAVLRVQTARGACLDVFVPADLMDEAGALWGKGPVRYEYRGGRAFFVSAE